ncbi:hypothetical protein HLY00_6003 [Mycolicibacterium hippocampi]|uniref:Uncharacterized protein n=1 Tax=Mycolicibacterium hippocampi TaxID=659824 RepID=A0A850PKY4_9MYCO|nr:hypothetical protein [Mycolicibacterium hippocampi]
MCNSSFRRIASAPVADVVHGATALEEPGPVPIPMIAEVPVPPATPVPAAPPLGDAQPGPPLLPASLPVPQDLVCGEPHGRPNTGSRTALRGRRSDGRSVAGKGDDPVVAVRN